MVGKCEVDKTTLHQTCCLFHFFALFNIRCYDCGQKYWVWELISVLRLLYDVYPSFAMQNFHITSWLSRYFPQQVFDVVFQIEIR
jgi:hypothetical protein